MMLMPANHSGATIHYLAGKYPDRLGWLVGPSARKKTKLRHWMPYALDNDAFSAWTNKTEWDADEWRAMLKWARTQCSGAVSAMMQGKTPRWLVVPDVVADRSATLENWGIYAPEAAEYGWPLAFAVQDGMTPDDVPDDADVIFVGGTDDWKWSTVETWCSNFPRVHVGRVNELRRLFQCEDLGVESVDGTGWFRDTDEGRRVSDIFRWLNNERGDQQAELAMQI